MSKRLKFFISHLSISFIIVMLALSWIFLVWYPSPLAKATGLINIILMMMVIDVIIGPILGFLVFKEGKKTLVLDLSIIILIQVSALGYGFYSIAEGRPAWIVYHTSRFELVRNNDIINNHIEQANEAYQHPSWVGPEYVAIKPSENEEVRRKNILDEVSSGVSRSQKPEQYISLNEVKSQLKIQTEDLEKLKEFNDANEVDAIIDKFPTATGYVPLKANIVDMTVLLNDYGEVVKIVDLRPW